MLGQFVRIFQRGRRFIRTGDCFLGSAETHDGRNPGQGPLLHVRLADELAREDRSAADARSAFFEPAQLQLTVDAHPARITAARAAAYLTPVLKWARKRELMTGPFELEKPVVDPPRQRVQDADELRKLLPTLDDTYGRCSMFLLLTAARRSEAVHATWSQIDFEAKTWTIPGEAEKTHGRRPAERASPRKRW